ncbi:hypothetical protein HPP92_013696 [Vanilla planifolia]|uniref:Plant heme peroxidase family profile domain-containing protein n=1 Tax=Vanilla planifolia TaxID=51239 RepID=A0A835R407_VANPL|nr:hypothetical protein HPP92_013696 [Vanilla planifolia]
MSRTSFFQMDEFAICFVKIMNSPAYLCLCACSGFAPIDTHGGQTRSSGPLDVVPLRHIPLPTLTAGFHLSLIPAPAELLRRRLPQRRRHRARAAVEAKFKETVVTIPGTLRLFAHDCFVQGCDASIMISSTAENKAERDHPDNLSLAGDGFDTVVRAKAAVDAVPQCRNKVSCADILVMATRDVIYLANGPRYPVELGRLDGLSSTAASVDGEKYRYRRSTSTNSTPCSATSASLSKT